MTPAELSRDVRAAFAYASRYVALLVSNNPKGNASHVFSRPDVDAVLAQAIEQGRELATQAITEAWGTAPRTQYLEWLLEDVDQSYDTMGLLRAEALAAWHSVPQAAFQPGVTPPGTNPATEVAHRRAEAVRQAIMDRASAIAMRNRLSAEVAAVAANTAEQIDAGELEELAGGKAWKQWRCRSSPPDLRTCFWCRVLHGVVIPLHANFPGGDPADLTGHGRLTKPPRVYRGKLLGPPRHPRCRCRIVIIKHLPDVSSKERGQGASTGFPVVGAEASAPNVASGFLAASDIRAMPEDRFQAVIHFLEAAVHELGQVLGRLRRLVSSQPSR